MRWAGQFAIRLCKPNEVGCKAARARRARESGDLGVVVASGQASRKAFSLRPSRARPCSPPPAVAAAVAPPPPALRPSLAQRVVSPLRLSSSPPAPSNGVAPRCPRRRTRPPPVSTTTSSSSPGRHCDTRCRRLLSRVLPTVRTGCPCARSEHVAGSLAHDTPRRRSCPRPSPSPSSCGPSSCSPWRSRTRPHPRAQAPQVPQRARPLVRLALQAKAPSTRCRRPCRRRQRNPARPGTCSTAKEASAAARRQRQDVRGRRPVRRAVRRGRRWWVEGQGAPTLVPDARR